MYQDGTAYGLGHWCLSSNRAWWKPSANSCSIGAVCFSHMDIFQHRFCVLKDFFCHTDFYLDMLLLWMQNQSLLPTSREIINYFFSSLHYSKTFSSICIYSYFHFTWHRNSLLYVLKEYCQNPNLNSCLWHPWGRETNGLCYFLPAVIAVACL